MEGTNPLEGRVEICLNSAWGTVCDGLFSMDDAEVICRQIDQQMDTVHNGTFGYTTIRKDVTTFLYPMVC